MSRQCDRDRTQGQAVEGTSAEEGCAVVIATHDDAVRDRCDVVLAVGDATHPVPVKERQFS
ncbi:hypothetical protein ACFWWM_20745 [Streptomyces sp. NPDC058682]|uniref:hypothetical protein n=1 Tax=unclassified Streptomyces TaxID=2593676 RepID=UPI0022598E9E|nr:hypothetical protein [Streptomyces sp. NBC_01214]MCX4800527.1 hypothetical protein [Streptomyces sp. NBC_01214]